MAMPLDVDARRYWRVAYQRLEDGALMLEKLDRPKAAVYLTGYAVECMLKALLIMSSAAGKRHEVVARFRGAIAHNLFWLRDGLAVRGVHLPATKAKELTFLSSWSTELRYEPGPGDREDAERFIRAARLVVKWADGRM